MQVQQRIFPDSATVVLSPCGDLSMSTVGQLRRALRTLDHDTARTVVVDLTDAVVHDSAVIHPLVELARRARAHGCTVVVSTGEDDDLGRRLAVYGLADRRKTPRN